MPAGRLMFQIIGATAEFDRAQISEQVRAGLAVARAKDRRLGRPPREGVERFPGRRPVRSGAFLAPDAPRTGRRSGDGSGGRAATSGGSSTRRRAYG
jgi:Resolvase, N terminal domain